MVYTCSTSYASSDSSEDSMDSSNRPCDQKGLDEANFSELFDSNFVNHGYDYSFMEFFKNFSFIYQKAGATYHFCLLESGEVKEPTSLKPYRIKKICLSPCRVIDPFISEGEIQALIPKDKRLVLIKTESDWDDETDEDIETTTLCVHQIWRDKICKPKKEQITVKMIDKHDADYKPCRFHVQKFDFMDEKTYQKFENMYNSVFLKNRLVFAKEELHSQKFHGLPSKWIKSKKLQVEEADKLLDKRLDELAKARLNEYVQLGREIGACLQKGPEKIDKSGTKLPNEPLNKKLASDELEKRKMEKEILARKIKLELSNTNQCLIL